MKTLQEKEIDHIINHKYINKYSLPQIEMDDEMTINSEMTILIKVTDTRNTGLTYPIIEYNNEQLDTLVEAMQSNIEQILNRPVRALKRTDSDCDVKVTIYNMKTLSDKQRVALQIEKEQQELSKVLQALHDLNNQRVTDQQDQTNQTEDKKEGKDLHTLHIKDQTEEGKDLQTLHITDQANQTDQTNQEIQNANFADIEPIDPSETISVEELLNQVDSKDNKDKKGEETI